RGPAAAVGGDDQLAVRVVVGAAYGHDVHGPQDRQVERLLVAREVPWHGVPARLARVDGGLREAGQVEDAVDGGHAQRLPAVLPRAAGCRVGVEHDEGARGARLLDRAHEPPPQKVVGGGQPGLTATDHDDGRPVQHITHTRDNV